MRITRRSGLTSVLVLAATSLTVLSMAAGADAPSVDTSATATARATRVDEPVTGESPVCARKYALQSARPDRIELLEFDPLVFAERVPRWTVREFVLSGEYPDGRLSGPVGLSFHPNCRLALGAIVNPTYTHVAVYLDDGTFEYIDLGTRDLLITPTLWGFMWLENTGATIQFRSIVDDSLLVDYPFRPGDRFLALAIDGRSAAMQRGDEILIYENQSIDPEPVLRIETRDLLNVEFSPSGQRIVIDDLLARQITHSDATRNHFDALTIVDIDTGVETTLLGVDINRYAFVTDDLFVTCGFRVHRYDESGLHRVRTMPSAGNGIRNTPDSTMCSSF